MQGRLQLKNQKEFFLVLSVFFFLQSVVQALEKEEMLVRSSYENELKSESKLERRPGDAL